MVIVAKNPSYLGSYTLGHSRLGMYNPRPWERLLEPHARAVTWRVANINVDRDPTTGHRVPDYSLTHSIQAVFEEIGGTLLPLPGGFTQSGDAVLWAFDGIRELDQIYLPESQRMYEVGYVHPEYKPLNQADSSITSFCYRVMDLHYVPLFKEG